MIYGLNKKFPSNKTAKLCNLITQVYIHCVDGTRIEFPPLVSKESVATLMAQMTAAAASAAASSAGLPAHLIPSTSEATDFVQQAMWMSRAQKLLEDEHHRNSLFKEICSTKDSSELAMALLHHGIDWFIYSG